MARFQSRLLVPGARSHAPLADGMQLFVDRDKQRSTREKHERESLIASTEIKNEARCITQQQLAET